MKKFLAVVLFCSVSLAVFAQPKTTPTKPAALPTKIGFFDERAVLYSMPGLDKVDTAVQKFMTDTIRPELTYVFNEYKEKDSAFRVDSATLPPRIRQIKMAELDTLASTLNNWNQIEQQAQQQKTQQLLVPFQKKMYDALQAVIKEGKYTHVLNAETALIFPDSDDLSIKVARKLGIPIEGEEPKASATKPK